MRGLFNSACVSTSITLQEIGRLTRGHFGNHIGGSLFGIYIRLPFTRVTAIMEWRERPLGFGLQPGVGALEVFVWRFQGVFCVEPQGA
jgi:hypothetical protein